MTLLTPQMAAYQEVIRLLPQMNGPQLIALRQVLQTDSQTQIRGLPDVFWWEFGGTVSRA